MPTRVLLESFLSLHNVSAMQRTWKNKRESRKSVRRGTVLWDPVRADGLAMRAITCITASRVTNKILTLSRSPSSRADYRRLGAVHRAAHPPPSPGICEEPHAAAAGVLQPRRHRMPRAANVRHPQRLGAGEAPAVRYRGGYP